MSIEQGHRDFDLNIERVLEGWSVSHAIREIIANALDEQALTDSPPVQIVQLRGGQWSIRDYGRGLRHTHLTQNESTEKHEQEPKVIGRFGVGLKDALAVLDRRQINVTINSAHSQITLVHRSKTGFTDVTTLHARLSEPVDDRMMGTEVLLEGVTDADVWQAQGFFLAFSGDVPIETTKYGTILQRPRHAPARIFVKGLLVAEEAEFAFSYNVTSLNQAMRRALNRERTNVGRSAYSERIKGMLLSAQSRVVAEALVSDLENLAKGTCHEEVRSWSDVGVRACQILSASGGAVFVTSHELVADKEMVDRAIGDGRRVIALPDSMVQKLAKAHDTTGRPVQTLAQFRQEWSATIEYQFVPASELTEAERAVYARWKEIAALVGGLPRNARLEISETMRPSVAEGMDPDGIWDEAEGLIVIHRRELKDLASFAGTLLHELTHAQSGWTDVSREFELALTDALGTVAKRALSGG